MIDAAGEWGRPSPITNGDIEIASIAHDLRNVLAIVQVAIDSMADGAAYNLCAGGAGLGGECFADVMTAIRDDIGTMRAAIQRGAALSRRLMTLQAPAVHLGVPFLADAVLADTVDFLARLMPCGVRLDCSGQSDGALLVLDRLDFERILMNLVLNARDSMPEGVVSLRISHTMLHDAETALLAIVPPGEYVTIDVCDQGCGFPPDIMARIGHGCVTTKAALGGTGLGLATVCRLVSASNGFLQVRSTSGQGTQMRLYFPWIGSEAFPENGLVCEKQIGLFDLTELPHCGTVLLVDDDELLRPIAARGLRQAGWTVIEAATGQTALFAIKQQPICELMTLVVDLALPDIDGLTLIKKLRALYGQARLPAVLISGYLPSKTILPDTSYLEKPCSMNELATALAALTEVRWPPETGHVAKRESRL